MIAVYVLRLLQNMLILPYFFFLIVSVPKKLNCSTYVHSFLVVIIIAIVFSRSNSTFPTMNQYLNMNRQAGNEQIENLVTWVNSNTRKVYFLFIYFIILLISSKFLILLERSVCIKYDGSSAYFVEY